MNKKILLIIALLLGGCSMLPHAPDAVVQKLDPIIVKVPVVQPCVTEEVALPELFLGKLSDADIADPGKVVQYYAADVTQLKGVVLRQKVLLEACRDGKEPPPAAPVPTAVLPPAPVPSAAVEPPLPVVAPKPTTPLKTPKPNSTRPSGRTFAPPPPPQ
jgi:hypothetical protein